jgi:hypothetical protein
MGEDTTGKEEGGRGGQRREMSSEDERSDRASWRRCTMADGVLGFSGGQRLSSSASNGSRAVNGRGEDREKDGQRWGMR